MKKIFYLITFLIINNISLADTNKNCEGILAKLKSDCNIVGKSMEKMREFSDKNKTINQSIDNIKKKMNK